MADDIHAMTLIATLVATSIVLIEYASAKNPLVTLGFVIKRFLVIIIIFFVVSPILLGHPPPRGVPSSPPWILLPSIFFISVLVRTKKIRHISITILVCVLAGLSMHYDSLLEIRNFIGSKNYSTLQDERNRRHLARVRKELSEKGGSDKTNYPDGWLRDVINTPEQNGLRRVFDSTSARQHDLWHSWLTGLYALEEREISLWYPGGTLETSGPRVVYRPRDTEDNSVEPTPGSWRQRPAGHLRR